MKEYSDAAIDIPIMLDWASKPPHRSPGGFRDYPRRQGLHGECRQMQQQRCDYALADQRRPLSLSLFFHLANALHLSQCLRAFRGRKGLSFRKSAPRPLLLIPRKRNAPNPRNGESGPNYPVTSIHSIRDCCLAALRAKSGYRETNQPKNKRSPGKDKHCDVNSCFHSS